MRILLYQEAILLTRYHRQGDVAAAREMLASTLKWRKEFNVDEVTKEAFDESVFGKVGIISGKDSEGRPVRTARATTRE